MSEEIMSDNEDLVKLLPTPERKSVGSVLVDRFTEHWPDGINSRQADYIRYSVDEFIADRTVACAEIAETMFQNAPAPYPAAGHQISLEILKLNDPADRR